MKCFNKGEIDNANSKNKKARTNLAIDFGFGQKSFGFCLAASGTF